MTYTGRVENGVIVLDDTEAILPEGEKVQVELSSSKPIKSIAERLKSVIGKAEGLPPDFAENHDHYLHGAAKKLP